MLTAEELADLRQDIGDTGSPQAFTDEQLQRNYARAGSDYNQTVVLTLRQLLASTARLHAYTAGQSSENPEQVYAHLLDLLAVWERSAGPQGGTMSAGVIDLGIDEDEPDEEWGGE